MRRLAALLLLASPAWAGAQATAPLGDLEWVQRQGAPVPMEAALRRHDGSPATLRQAAGGLPLILAPGYFRCPNLCGLVREDLADALDRSGMQAGRDYALAVVSIDPAETPADAAAAAAHHAGWQGLTGPAAAVAAIADAVGFRSRFDPAMREFLHPAGVAVLSPDGRVSGYALGVGYDPAALRDAVRLAHEGGQAQADPVLLLCFDFNSVTGRYTASIEKLLRVAAALTALSLGVTLLLAHRSRKAP